MVPRDARAWVAVCAGREVPPHVDPGGFGVGYQCAGRDSFTFVCISCPPQKFGLIRRVVLAQPFGKPRYGGECGTAVVVDHVEMHDVLVDDTAQYRFELIPAAGCGERQPIGPSPSDRLAQRTLVIADEVHPPKLDGRQVVPVVGIWEPLDGGMPSCGRSRDTEVIERRPATDDHF